MTLRRIALAYVGLLVLLALAVGSALIDLGSFNLVTNLAVAAAKSAVILFFFMNFLEHGPLPKLAALAGLVWLIILFALTLTDPFHS